MSERFNSLLRNALVGILFLIPFIPLVVTHFTIFPFVVGKNLVFRVLVEVAVGLWFLLAFHDISLRPKRSRIFFAVLLFATVVSLIDLSGAHISKSIWSTFERMDGLITTLHLALYFVVLGSMVHGRELWQRFWHISIGVSIFSFLYSFLQLTNELPILSRSDRVEGTFGNASYLAVFMLFHIFLTLILWSRTYTAKRDRDVLLSFLVGFGLYLLFFVGFLLNPAVAVGSHMFFLAVFSVLMCGVSLYLWRQESAMSVPSVRAVLYSALVLMQIFTLFITATRGAMLGFLLGIASAAVFFCIQEKKKILRIGVLGVLLACVLFLAGIFAMRSTTIVQHNAVLSRLTRISVEQARPRILVLEIAWRGFLERPILGWGQENFDMVFDKYYDARLAGEEPWFDRAHNIVFDWLVAGGIFGVLVYLTLFAVPLFIVWKKSSDSFSPLERALLGGLCIGYLIHNIFIFESITSSVLFFSLLAYLHSVLGTRPFKNRFWMAWEEKKFLALRSVRVLFMGAVTLGVLYVANVSGARAVVALRRVTEPRIGGPAENLLLWKDILARSLPDKSNAREMLVRMTLQLLASKAPAEIKNKFALFTITELTKEIEENPNVVRPLLTLGEFYRRIGRYEEALPYLEKAWFLSPNRPHILLETGIVYISMEAYDRARAVLAEAYARAPNYRDVALTYAASLQYTGASEDATRILRELGHDSLPMNSTILRAYAKTGHLDLVAKTYEREVAINPENIQTRIFLASAYIDLRDADKAIKALQDIINIEPSFAERSGNTLIADLRAGHFPRDLEKYRGY